MRVNRLDRRAKLRLPDLRNLYTLYKAGYSIRDLACKGWRQWGFASEMTCSKCIQKGFQRQGWHVRSYAEAYEMRLTGPQPGLRDARGRFIKKGS